MNTSNWRRLGAAAITCALSACGGGGGGGGGDSVGSVQVTADRSSVAMIALNQSPMSSEPVYFTISGGKGTYYASATADNDAFNFSFTMVSDTEANVVPTPVTDIPVGTRHTGHITFQLCSDQSCQHVVWSDVIAYTMTRFSVDTRAQALTGYESAVGTPVTLAIAPPDVGANLAFSSSNTAAVTVDHTDPARVVLTPLAMGAGTHASSADIDIGYRSHGTVAAGQGHIPVSVTLASGIAAPTIGPLEVMASTPRASLAGQAPVSFVAGQGAAWSAASDRAWLVLDSASGSGAGNIAWHVDTAQLASLANWSSDTATVTISSVGMTPAISSVIIHMALPEVTIVNPTAVIAGRASSVRVTGRGFSQLAGASAISVGGVSPVGGSIDSDAAATLQLPALVAGSASVSVPNLLGVASRSAALGVTPAGAFRAAMVANPGSKSSMAFDASRNAVFATNQELGRLVRYQLVAGQWQVSELPINNVGKLALSPDRRTVYVTSGVFLNEVDPDSLQIVAQHIATDDLNGYELFGEPLAMTDNLRLWFGNYQWSSMRYFDMRSGSFGAQDLSGVGGIMALNSPSFYATPDGSAMMIADCMCLSPQPPNDWYDSASDKVSINANEPFVYNDVKFDERGSVMLVDSQTLVRTDTFATLGSASFDSGISPGGAVLSPDGKRIYREVYDGNSKVDHIEVFDATTLASGHARFVDLGAIALPDKAVSCPQTTGFCDTPGRLAVDPTGSTLFWVGDAGLVIVPIPSAMSGVTSFGRAHAADTSRLRSALPAPTASQVQSQVRMGRVR